MATGLILLALAALLVAALVAERGDGSYGGLSRKRGARLPHGEAAHAESAREREAEAVRRGAEAARQARDTAQREAEAARQAQHGPARRRAAQRDVEAARRAQARPCATPGRAARRRSGSAGAARGPARRRSGSAGATPARATPRQRSVRPKRPCRRSTRRTPPWSPRRLSQKRSARQRLEEARQARAERDSFALEVRVLRAELSTARKPVENAPQAAEKLGGTSVKPRTPKTSEQPGKTSWWCQQCGRGGTRPERCCR